MRHNHIIPGHHTPSTELWQTHAPPPTKSTSISSYRETPSIPNLGFIWSIWWQSSSSGWRFLLRADKPLWQSCYLSNIQLAPIWFQLGEALRPAFIAVSGKVPKEKPHQPDMKGKMSVILMSFASNPICPTTQYVFDTLTTSRVGLNQLKKGIQPSLSVYLDHF